MQKVEQLVKKIIKKSKDKEARYFYGYEYSSDSGPNYKAVVQFSRTGVPPLLCGARTEVGLRKELQRYVDGEDVKDIAIQYCLAQIHAEEQAIKFHENLIKDYENMNEDTHTEL